MNLPSHRNHGRVLALAALTSLVSVIPAGAQTYTVLHHFQGGPSDGENPESGVVMDTQGNFYGTTLGGPSSTSFGMVYEVSPTGTETILHRFRGNPDGASPYAGLLLSSSNISYGTTSAGGASNMGVVFTLSTSGEKVLHSFSGSPGDGAFPYAGLVQDSAGNVYGTTSAGGASNNGTVFKITPAGTESVLYSFKGGSDGVAPYGGLVWNASGSLYGVTSSGGFTTGNCFPSGCGVIFSVTAAGREKVLYRFTGSPDGAYPYGGLIADTTGNLYGTTYNGGTGPCTNGCGTIFELTKGGADTVLYSFQGFPFDGAFPYAGLVRNSSGNLYGTTTYGGTTDNGAVFELDASGVETVVYNFTGAADGGVPRTPLIQDSNGVLYGTTYGGGSVGARCGTSPSDTCGVMFRLKP